MTDRDDLDGLLLGKNIQRFRYEKVRAALVAEGWRPPPRVIETVAELDALQPAQEVIDSGRSGATCFAAVIEDAKGRIFERDVDNLHDEVNEGRHTGWWITGHGRDDIDSTWVAYPVTVLREPEEES